MEKFMGKKLRSQLNGGRQGQGGFGPFMSLLMDERMGTATSRQQNNVGRVIKRGKSIAMTEAHNTPLYFSFSQAAIPLFMSDSAI
ncbi:small nuclear ribonucleoprotein G-like [Panthera pardus]|uniref:Small nuclear ribonucleoprotein G-like n=2 Tax=Panthera TaxID=9688 RepID=A0A9W2VPL9_PANPR|nr:small nuclear ribonucleoprotein G-like [Panthera pardus]